MPNWCDNRLIISGDKETLLTFIEKVRNTDEQAEKRHQRYDILNNLIPCPTELINSPSGFSNDENAQAEREKREQNNKAKYGFKDWYDWQYANWGTKWGDSSTDLMQDDPYATSDGNANIEFVFQTPWGPPIAGIEKIAIMFPTLQFGLAYYEEGMDFYGLATFQEDGVFDNCMEISDIEGIAELDALDEDENNEYDVWDKRNDLICQARDRLLEEAGF